ncbi:MAG TPA: DUF1801 domain-containing protein [Kofleriaceae bacterium]|nr:DUF1801 domain-containing protein [Kofleriaceae bacterium]
MATTKRADFGKPVDGYIKKRSPDQQKILTELKKLITAAAPECEAQIKWGMPHYTIGGKYYAATPAHKAHVNLIMFGPAKSFDDPDGLLEGEGKVGRHLKIATAKELPKAKIKKWLAIAAKASRSA